MALAYLLDPCLQHQNRAGVNNVDGWFEVFRMDTDDRATIYTDFNGTLAPARNVIDNNGRVVMIAESGVAYRVAMYLPNGELVYTQQPVFTVGSGGAGGSTEIISTDGSISIDKSNNAGVTTFDLGLAPSSTEFLEWCKCLNLSISNGLISPEFAEGSMTTDENGLHVYKDRFYHITCTLRVDPTGNGIFYNTLSATLKYSDGTEVDLVRRNYDIDNSVNDPTLCEFSYDFNCPADGYLYMYVEGVVYFEQVDVALQVHRVYSGINAVPDTCATQQWVRGYFDYDMSAHIPYSALNYDSNNEIIGISGSAIAGSMNSDRVSAIASSYAESAVSSLSGSISSKMDASASSLFQLSGNYYSASNPSGFISNADLSSFAKESSLSSKLDASASSEFYPTSNPSGFLSNADLSSFAKESSLSSKLDASASSEFYPTSNPSGFLTAHQSLAGYATESYVDSAVSGKLDATASSQFLTSLPDDLAYTSDVASAVSGKLDASASSSFYPMDSNPSGYLTAHQSLDGYATVEYVDSSVSGKLDVTAYNSAQFYTTANPSGFITGVDLTPYQLTADMSGYYTTANESGFIDSAYVEGQVSSKQDVSAMTAYQAVSAMTAYAYNSSLSSKLDASAASGFYTTANESGFVDSAYVESAVSGKLDASASSDFVLNSSFSSYSSNVGDTINNMSSSITSIETSITGIENNITSISSDVSGKVDETAMTAWIPYSALDYSGTAISGIGGSSLAGMGGGADYSGVAPVNVDNDTRLISVDHRTLCVDDTMTAYNSGSSAVIGVNVDGLDLSSKMDASASSLFYPSDNPSGYITGVDLTPYQLTADMSAYQLSGNYLSATESSNYYSTSNPSGFITGVDLTDYATTSYVDSSVSGKLDATASSQFITSTAGLATTGDVESAVSGKLDSSSYDSSQFYLTSNPSGFITGVDLSNYATTAYVDSSVSSKLDATASSQFLTSTAGLVGTADLSAYAYESSNSAKLDATAFSNVSGTFLTAVPAGYATEAFVNSSISGFAYESAVSGWTAKQDALTFGYDSSNNISSIDGSALAGGGGASYSAGNMIKISSDVISFSSQAGITNIVLVTAMPVSPDANVLYLVREVT